MDESKVRYMICDELREAVAPYLNKLLTSQKQSVRFMIEQYACGIVNLYGFLLFGLIVYTGRLFAAFSDKRRNS